MGLAVGDASPAGAGTTAGTAAGGGLVGEASSVTGQSEEGQSSIGSMSQPGAVGGAASDNATGVLCVVCVYVYVHDTACGFGIIGLCRIELGSCHSYTCFAEQNGPDL